MRNSRNKTIKFRCNEYEMDLLFKLANGKVSNLRNIFVGHAKAVYDDNNVVGAYNVRINELDAKILYHNSQIKILELERDALVEAINKYIDKK